jgi:uncharacterized protein YwgA
MVLTMFDLLSLVAASDGKVEHRIRLQKEAFFLQWLGLSLFRDVHFTYHHFGPHSRELSEALHEAVTSGLLKEHVYQTENVTKYAYELTSRGSDVAKHRPTDASVAAVIKGLNQEPWRALELAATALYLQGEEALDQSGAMERALSLKPGCRTQRATAESIIAKLARHRVEAVA